MICLEEDEDKPRVDMIARYMLTYLNLVSVFLARLRLRETDSPNGGVANTLVRQG